VATSIQRHGYKGGLELTATVDYLVGYEPRPKSWMTGCTSSRRNLCDDPEDHASGRATVAQNLSRSACLNRPPRYVEEPRQPNPDALQAFICKRNLAGKRAVKPSDADGLRSRVMGSNYRALEGHEFPFSPLLNGELKTHCFVPLTRL